ncbi:MAG: hypothetical protein HYX46_14410 [Betaproteobacteria bacterium]|nr:hypothetical protein [Betaproteobacteria bacterium]
MSGATDGTASNRSKLGAVLAPARTLMDRLSYPRKFALISVLFALPLAVVMYLLVSEINDRIDFARKEILGDRYLRPLRTLQEHAGQSRMLARAYAKGEVVLRPDLIRAQAAIDDDFSLLEGVEQELGEILKTPARFGVLRENRRFLKDDSQVAGGQCQPVGAEHQGAGRIAAGSDRRVRGQETFHSGLLGAPVADRGVPVDRVLLGGHADR